MNQLAMIVKAAGESLTKPPDFSTRNATICCTSENSLAQSDLDAVFRKTPSEILKYLLVVNRDSCDSDVSETNANETAKKRKNTDESFERARKIVTHGEIDSVTNKIKQNSFCSNFYHDKRSLEMGVLSSNCDTAKCKVVSIRSPLADVKYGNMDENYKDTCPPSGNEHENTESCLFSEEVQNFRDILRRAGSSEESSRTEPFSDDDLSLLPEVLPQETLNFILSATEKNLNIESPDSGPQDSSSDCSEFTDLVPFSPVSPVASTSKEFPQPEQSKSDKSAVKTKIKDSVKDKKNVQDDEMVLVPSGKFAF